METTKIKMNMDGTFRAKVLQYKSDGNTLTEKWHTLTKFAEGIYFSYTTPDRYGHRSVNIIFSKNGIFWRIGGEPEHYFNPDSFRYAEHMEILKRRYADYEADIMQAVANGSWLNKLHITVMERLGHDTTAMIEAYNERRRKMEELDRQRAEEAERRERERKEAEERRNAELLADGKEKLMNHECITVEQIELIAEAVGYKIHVRTIGFMREKVTEAVLREDDTVTVWGRKLTSRNIDGTTEVMCELYDRLKAQVEEEARQPATPAETPQISTEAAETVNISVEEEKEADTKEMPRYECPNYADYAFERGWSIENTDFDAHSGVLCMIHFDPTDERYVCGCLWQINSDSPNYTEHRRFKTLKGAQNYGTKRMGMKLEYQTLTVYCPITPTEPPQSSETPQTIECTTDAPKPRETARKPQNRGIGGTQRSRRSGLGAGGYVMLDNASATLDAMSVPHECSTAEAAYW